MTKPVLPAGTRDIVYPTAADHMKFFKYEMMAPVLEVETIHARVLDGTFAPIAEFDNIGELGWTSLTIGEIMKLHIARIDYTYIHPKDTIEICHMLDHYIDETSHLAEDRAYRSFMTGLADYRRETIIHARQTIMRNPALMDAYIKPESSIISMFSKHVLGKVIDITTVFDLDRPLPTESRTATTESSMTTRYQDVLAGNGASHNSTGMGTTFFKSGG